MRDPYRFLFTIYEIWQCKHQDIRFGQMMEIMRARYGDTFYMEDDEFLEKFKELFETE